MNRPRGESIRVTASAVPLAVRDRALAEYAPVFLKWLSVVRKRSESTVRSDGEDLKSFLRVAEEAGLTDRGEPSCERCGLGAFHFACDTDAIARSPKERVFWASTSDEEAEPLTRFALFLCPGCRS